MHPDIDMATVALLTALEVLETGRPLDKFTRGCLLQDLEMAADVMTHGGERRRLEREGTGHGPDAKVRAQAKGAARRGAGMSWREYTVITLTDAADALQRGDGPTATVEDLTADLLDLIDTLKQNGAA